MNGDFTCSDRLLSWFLLGCAFNWSHSSLHRWSRRRFRFLEIWLPRTSCRFNCSLPELALLFFNLFLNRRDFRIEIIEFLKLSLIHASEKCSQRCSVIFNTLLSRLLVLLLSVEIVYCARSWSLSWGARNIANWKFILLSNSLLILFGCFSSLLCSFFAATSAWCTCCSRSILLIKLW